MRVSTVVNPTCIEVDKQCKVLSSEYKRSARIIKKRIDEIHNELIHLAHKSPLRIELKERLEILNQMYRTTSEIGREAEHYYEKSWWRSEIYTLNTR